MNKRKKEKIKLVNKECKIYYQLMKEKCDIKSDVYCETLQSLYNGCIEHKINIEK